MAAATGLYAATVLPLMRLARADHLTPRVVREFPVTAAVLLMLLTPPTVEVTR
ncbi:hypothetical protein [Streptomyces sp. NPDC091383]|uniref:hypothetical protein n=1 Tax=Streptomyces sp. NPDC091383 TaxID=3365996 RepID=UPI00164F109A|nr:hypothetical protein [Streptomyces lavendulae]